MPRMSHATIVLIGLAALLLQQTPSTAQSAGERGETCRPTTEREIAALFTEWNDALRSGRPEALVALYAPRSILLPTLSNTPRLSADAKKAYFEEFMRRKPVGTIDTQFIEIDCNAAFDAGTYTFRFADGGVTRARFSYTYKWNGQRWAITSHHSSAMPERD